MIALLDRRTMRFTELRGAVDGVSQRMLRVTLRQLERDGLVKRTVYPVVPPRVEYELTELGISPHEVIKSLVVWTEEHQLQISAARTAYDERIAEEQLQTSRPVTAERSALGAQLRPEVGGGDEVVGE